jgi:hypothetical protein
MLLLSNMVDATFASRDSGWKAPRLRHKPTAPSKISDEEVVRIVSAVKGRDVAERRWDRNARGCVCESDC